VLGIEVENTTRAEIYDNEVYDNTTGFLLDLLPNLPKKNSTDYYVHDNHVYDNDRANFAEKNSTASSAPAGTGILVLAATNVEITKNLVENNDSAGVLIVSYDIIDIITTVNGGTPQAKDPETPRWPHDIYVHDNTYKGNGTAPKESLALLAQGPDGGQTIDYSVLWDGILAPDATDVASTKICVGSPEKTSFLNFHADTSLLNSKGWTTDTSDNQCEVTVKPPSL
jgi:parallel beta-helix repeat protein